MSKRKLKGIYSGYVDVGGNAKPLIDTLVCDEVWLSVWNAVDDNNDTPVDMGDAMESAGEEAYWGFINQPVHQIFPTHTERAIPVTNANEIFVRANRAKGGALIRVFFSCFEEVE